MLRGKWNWPRSGSEQDDVPKRELEIPDAEKLGRSAIEATFAEHSHQWGYIGAALVAEELAGPPKSDAERAVRAAQWRLCHLLYDLSPGSISQEEIDEAMVAAYPDFYGSARETPDGGVAVEDWPPES